MSQRILIAEDEDDVRRLVASNLRLDGFETLLADNGPQALEAARAEHPDLIVLDLMLPLMNGLDVCKLLKADPKTAGIPIVMLTAKAEEVDRIVGLEIGADDYITKPFSPRELVLRVKSVLRRAAAPAPADTGSLEVGKIRLDRERCVARIRNRVLDLTPTEFKLLALLMERRGRVQSRDRLLSDVWGYDSSIDTRTVDTHVRRLREKLGSAADAIETVRGFGYRMADHDA